MYKPFCYKDLIYIQIIQICVFILIFFQLVSQNGCSYKSSKLDSIKCEVQYKNKLIESAMVYSKDTESEIFLHFTPTVSNVAYEISILANAQHVGSSPISSIFDPGKCFLFS